MRTLAHLVVHGENQRLGNSAFLRDTEIEPMTSSVSGKEGVQAMTTTSS
jgi:hypothetical protein